MHILYIYKHTHKYTHTQGQGLQRVSLRKILPRGQPPMLLDIQDVTYTAKTISCRLRWRIYTVGCRYAEIDCVGRTSGGSVRPRKEHTVVCIYIQIYMRTKSKK